MSEHIGDTFSIPTVAEDGICDRQGQHAVVRDAAVRVEKPEMGVFGSIVSYTEPITSPARAPRRQKEGIYQPCSFNQFVLINL